MSCDFDALLIGDVVVECTRKVIACGGSGSCEPCSMPM